MLYEVTASLCFGLIAIGLLWYRLQRLEQPHSFTLWMLPVACFIILSLDQAGNWLWGWQLAAFMTATGIAGVVCALSGSTLSWKHATFAMLMAALAVYNFSTGLITLPVGAFMIALHRATLTRKTSHTHHLGTLQRTPHLAFLYRGLPAFQPITFTTLKPDGIMAHPHLLPLLSRRPGFSVCGRSCSYLYHHWGWRSFLYPSTQRLSLSTWAIHPRHGFRQHRCRRHDGHRPRRIWHRSSTCLSLHHLFQFLLDRRIHRTFFMHHDRADTYPMAICTGLHPPAHESWQRRTGCNQTCPYFT